ncbi:MAG: GH3 auxin-responsive promoter family protein [Scytonema sp. PMC 1069.18]|nr:GH3 auxin-responsive promoter family protein [Scytonema sp. PMC 1069.18]MEC4883599.1 GH3 auxin-responsive promoter family protein [Scytonema sp. PMC 1070.18]
MSIFIKILSQLLAPSSYKFLKALENPQAAQKSVQEEIIRRLANSEYGQSLGIQSLSDWSSVPIVEYHDMEKWILRQQESRKSILSSEPILFYEQTSGSRGAAKLIPYTKSLRRSFNHMFCVWAHDLIVHGPKFSYGKIYFCISPQFSHTPHPTPHSPSLEDDSEYLDSWLRWLLRPFLVSPPGLSRLRNAEEFKHKLSQALLLEEHLEIISVWSPSFLKVILDYIQTNRTRLCRELGNRLSPQRRQLLLNPPPTDKHQGEEDRIPWTLLWRDLKLISCWDSVHAADGAGFLRFLFPNVLVQGKGLLATEAPMTVPLISAKGCVPVLDEVFFEFEDEQGEIFLLHELKKGCVYEIILSGKGGLYRYRIGDRVRVTHFYLGTPCLEFLGRTREISDLVGEKLNFEFVCQVLDTLPLQEACFKSLLPVKKPKEHYVLLLDQAKVHPHELAQQLDASLLQSPQYRYARLLGQLQPVRVLVSPRIPEIVTLHKTRSGQKWGDLKHEIFSTTPLNEELLRELEKV